jgi:hypothetical protein
VLIVLLVLAAVAVFVTAAIAVNAAVDRTAAQPPPAVLELDDAVEWIAERVPFEVAAQISHDDVRQILLWQLDFFDSIGLAAEGGAELGGEVVPADHAAVVADEQDAVDFVVERALASRRDLTPLHVVCVLDLQMQYLREIGAVGGRAEAPDPRDDAPGAVG